MILISKSDIPVESTTAIQFLHDLHLAKSNMFMNTIQAVFSTAYISRELCHFQV